MKWFLMYLFTFGQCFADSRMSLQDWKERWLSVFEIEERNSGYESTKTLNEPQGTWQQLMIVRLLGSDVGIVHRQCLWFHVPRKGKSDGVLKIIAGKECHRSWEQKAVWEIGDIRSLAWIDIGAGIQFSITWSNAKLSEIKIRFANSPRKRQFERFNSSAELRQYGSISVLGKSSDEENVNELLDDGILCHDITEDCSEKSPSRCQNCRHGFYTIPNGCEQGGPKICGIDRCGQKGQPACLRGTHYLRMRGKIDCTLEKRFGFCEKGVMPVCEGDRLLCH